MLVESGKTVRDVLEIILDKTKYIDQPDRYYHQHLYNVGAKSGFESTFMVFNHHSGSKEIPLRGPTEKRRSCESSQGGAG